jgi:hypothetical protein
LHDRVRQWRTDSNPLDASLVNDDQTSNRQDIAGVARLR